MERTVACGERLEIRTKTTRGATPYAASSVRIVERMRYRTVQMINRAAWGRRPIFTALGHPVPTYVEAVRAVEWRVRTTGGATRRARGVSFRDHMIYLRMLVAFVMFAAFVWLSALNWITIVRHLVGKVAPSWVPLLAGLLGAGAAQIFPSATVQRRWWGAFLVDGGSLLGLTFTAIWYLFRTGDGGKRPR